MKVNSEVEKLVKILGEEEYRKEFDHYRSFGWSKKVVLAYMLKINSKRSFEDAMADYLYN